MQNAQPKEPPRDAPGEHDGAPARAVPWAENRRLLAEDHRAGRVVLRGRPAHLKIELTNFCNLSCPMCPHGQMRRPVGYMDPALFRRVIDQAAPALEFAYVHHLGESLFHGRVAELIAYGRARGVAMGLSTNATYLTEKKARAILAAGLDFLVVSLDAASPESYAQMRPGGDFAGTAAHVRRLLELRGALGARTRVVVQMIASPHNQHEAAEFAAVWRRQGGDVMLKVARDWAGQVPLSRLLATAGRAAQAPPPPPAPEPVLHTPCRMLWTELTVLWDGQVVPCANVYEHENVLGDLTRQGLDEVWNAAPIQALRRAHLQDEVAGVPVCGTCPRHRFDHEGFVAKDQLAQRIEHYVRPREPGAATPRADLPLTPRPGLS